MDLASELAELDRYVIPHLDMCLREMSEYVANMPSRQYRHVPGGPMNISQLLALLQKVSQLSGDVPILIKAAEDGAETVIHAVHLSLAPEDGAVPSVVHLVHGEAPWPASPEAPQSGDQAA